MNNIASNTAPLTIAQIFGALSKHRYKAFSAWLLVMIMVTAAFVLLPRKYGSEGQLYVQLGRNNATLSPASGSASISIQDTRETEIRSVVELIRSRAVMDAIVDDIGADKILASPMEAFIPRIWLPDFNVSASSGMSKDEVVAHRLRELATMKLIDDVDVHVEKKTSVVKIFAKASSPKLAQEIVQRAIEHTQAVHLKVHASASTKLFFDDQFDAQEKCLEDATQNLADFRTERKVLSVGAERSTLQGILSNLENDILMSEVEVEKSAQGLKKLQYLMANTDAQIFTPTTGVERKSYEDAQATVFNLESERERLVATYRESHPQVKQIDQQLRKIKQTLNNLVDGRTEQETTSSPIYEAVRVDLIRAETEFAAASARLKSLNEKQLISLSRLKGLNQAEVESEKLQRNIDVARQYLANYTQKRGEANAMNLLDAGEHSDIAVAQNATLWLKHVSPRGGLFLPLGFIVGLLAAFATALFYERNHLSPSLTESDVEQILGVPVLVTLPKVYSSRNMVN